MNLAIRISSLAAGLIAADDGPTRPIPGAGHHPAGRNEWQIQARKLHGPTSMAKLGPLLCHLKRPTQLRATMMGRDNCHGTSGELITRSVVTGRIHYLCLGATDG